MPSHRFDGFTKVKSDHIDGVKYEPMTRIMQVRFQNGYVYAVHGVSPDDHQALMSASSQGEHYHKFIKDQYAIERVR
jgi:hypothetical protein